MSTETQKDYNVWDKYLVKNIQRNAFKSYLNNLTENQKNEIKAWNAKNSSFIDSSNKLDNLMKTFADKYSKTPYIPLSYNEKQINPIVKNTKIQETELPVNEDAKEKINWLTQMFNLGYKAIKTTTGATAYKGNDGTIYYDNGRMQKNNQMSAYDYTQLGQNTQPVINTQSIVQTNRVKTQPIAKHSKFNTDEFLKSDLGKGKKYTFGNTTYVRYDPNRQGDFYINPNTGAIYESRLFGTLGNEVQYNPNWKNDNPYAIAYRTLKQQLDTFYKRNGGKMNKTKYFQQGGVAPQQDLQQQIIALVQAAMQGDQQATQQVNQIMEAAKTGDPQATQIAQIIQQVVQQIQGQATSAKWGAKLRYIKSLKYSKGGKTCPECEKKKSAEKIVEKKCGGKAKKRYFGGIL